MQEEFVVLDTSSIQRDSLHTFMARLNYKFDEDQPSRFVTEGATQQANRYISFDTAQRLHNSTVEDWQEFLPGWFRYKHINLNLGLNAYDLQQLFAVKLVQKTKWLHTRKGGHKITMKSPMVKPAHSSMTSFLGLV